MISEPTGQDNALAPTRTKRWPKWLMFASVCIGLCWISFPSFTQWFDGVSAFDKQSITSSPVFRGTLLRDIAVSGKLVAANAPTVYATEAGQVTLQSKPGDYVAQGDVIATLTSPELKAIIAQQESTLARLEIEASRGLLADNEVQLDLERSLDTAQVKLNASKRELTRAQLSFDRQVISEIDFVTTKDAQLEAQLMYNHALKRVELAKKRLAFENQTRTLAVDNQQLIVDELKRRQQLLAIRAPVAGIVGNWLIQQKERVSDSQPIMTIVDLSQYEAELNVPEFYADDLGLGLDVQLSIAGKKLTGTINSISPEVKNSQIMVRVSVVPNEQIKLRQNQRLNARIEFEKKDDVLMVKRGDFLSSTGGKAAFVLTEQHAKKRPITIGSSSVDYVEIISGLNENDVVITSSYDDFEQHQTIKITQ